MRDVRTAVVSCPAKRKVITFSMSSSSVIPTFDFIANANKESPNSSLLAVGKLESVYN